MRGNLFLVFVAVGIGFGAVAYGYGGVLLLILGISLGGLAWGALMSILRHEREAPRFLPRARQPSRIH